MKYLIATAMIIGFLCRLTSAQPTPQRIPYQKPIDPPPIGYLDTFDDTISYDDGIDMWWCGGLNNFTVATRFTPFAEFELQAVAVLFAQGTGWITVFLTDTLDGDWIWVDTLYYESVNQWQSITIDTTGFHLYQGFEDFYLGYFTPGPPYEAFDISPSIPQRSYLKWSTSTNYAPSPGDNLIRAVGQYNADYEDAGIDAVWNGDGFFIYENDSIQISCAVFNCGDTGPVNCTVGCYFYTESGSAYTFF
ncbi:MAG: hypothetical protein ABIE92_03730, partial [bacterium]